MGRSGWAAIGAAVAVTLGSGGISLVRAAPEVKSEITPIAPCRLIDTRPGAAFGTIRAPIGARQTVVIGVFGSNGACNIPNGATAIDVNITALNTTAARTFVTAYPAGDPRPAASQLNPSSAVAVTSNGTSITLSTGGQFALYNDAGSVNLIIDVLAYYTPATSSAGEPGPRGPAGAQGPAGSQGATGARGVAGARGVTGARGAAGDDGATGAAGTRGPAGADGVDGVDGATGPTGPAGGEPGEAGPQGPAGVDGVDGIDGAAGPAGAVGETGLQGPSGSDGEDGDVGPTGADGATGPAGVNGEPGEAGPQGSAGADGVDGAQGETGANGVDGAEGPAGVDGADGGPGTDGAQGPAGPQGPAGADGEPIDFVYLQVVGPVSDSGNPKSRTVSALCPFGKFVVGGGFEINSASDGNHEPPFVTKSAPSSSNTWTVTAERGSIARANWSVQAYAICVGV